MSGIAVYAPPGGFPHGTRARYVGSKCRCDECRRANREYARARARATPNGLVDAASVRAHLTELAKQGIGRRTVAAASDVSLSAISLVRTGRKLKLRAQTAARLMAVDASAIADGALVRAVETRAALRELRRLGLSKREIARRLGSTAESPSLQLTRRRVTAKNALKVTKLLAAVRAEHAAKRAERRCGQCDESHGESRFAVLRELGAEDLADLPRTWPCLYGGAKGAALLAEDLKRIAPEAE